MRIAILGANSQIASDLILSLAPQSQIELALYVRRPDEMRAWLTARGLTSRYDVAGYDHFTDRPSRFDAILNFVGSGNPVHTAAMGSTILQVTQEYDDLALRHLERQPDCRYIFLSSGAAYGGDFAQPVGDDSIARIPINRMAQSDWYGLAKLYAEGRHRARPDLAIVDLRVFNYFSHTLDTSNRFLISDILCAIQNEEELQTSTDNIVRDYLGPQEMHQLMQCILDTPPCNVAVDCYTQNPVDKLNLLTAMAQKFGLRYQWVSRPTGFTATGTKANYFSLSRKAGDLFGYAPSRTALEVVLEQASFKIKQARHP